MAATYCTTTDVKDSTNDIAIKELGETILTKKIELAEIYIDAFAGYWEKYDSDQSRTFPRVQDYKNASTFIPDAVREATVAQVEFMFRNMPDRDHGITEDDKPTMESISPRAKMLMHGYTKRTGRMVFPETEYGLI